MPERLGIRLSGRLALLLAALRAGGARAGVEQLRAAQRALASVDVSDRRAAYDALRPVLGPCHRDPRVFDAAFAEWFGGDPPARAEPDPRDCEAERPHVAEAGGQFVAFARRACTRR